MKVVVVGAGVIGVLTALRLAQAGAGVTLVEAGRPAGAASGASFGWVNASFFADADHFRLRHAAIDAHHRLAGDLGTQAIAWPGCLCWEDSGAAFQAQHDALSDLGYAVRVVDADEFARLEPHVVPPTRALHFRMEGTADLVALTRDVLAAGTALGMRLICGLAVTGFAQRGGALTGVETATGVIPADRVVLAGGVGSEALLAGVDVTLPMLHRPSLILRSRPMPPFLNHVLVAPGQEVRQDRDGAVLAPTAASHQRDATAIITQTPDVLADAAAARISTLVGRRIDWAQVTLAQRPVPADGLPVIGPCGPAGLYVTTMHSGATLGPLVAEVAAREVMDAGLSNTQAALLAPYRPDRFQNQNARKSVG